MSVKEMILDSKHECMSRDEMAALQGERLVDLVNRVYNNVPFYTKKMKELGVEPGDIKGIEDIVKLPFTTKEDLRNNSDLEQYRSQKLYVYRELQEQQVSLL